jgi:hypothetical protein
MYNIHRHYHNIWQFAKTIVDDPRVAYLHPFGSTSPENLEVLADNRPDLNYFERGPVILCYDQEPLISGYTDHVLKHVMEYLIIDDPNKVILLNTEPHSQDKNVILEKFGFREAYCFFHIFAVSDWYRGHQFDRSLIPLEKRTLKKKYITFNRLTGHARVYRSMLVAELQNKSLLEHGYVSYSHECPLHGHYSQNLNDSIGLYNIDPAYSQFCIDQLDSVDFPLRIDSDESSIPNGSMALGAMKENMESFLHVVTETCYWEDKHHLTEKIFKPIFMKQPFVLLGPVGNLEYLKSHGFQTFDRWWDESYDKISDPVVRLQAVVSVIDQICALTLNELGALLEEMAPVLEHNHSLVASGLLLDHAWNELCTNLTHSLRD